ncbi:MAG: hypothetical protein JO205_08280 [Pseudolabrys sp.]|nr:hypothetical protein [Pseudolabrys sp.]MBV9261355.1 hypothetical protein [Pseudolabrys sp.]
MQLHALTSFAFHQLLGRLLWRLLGVALIGLFAIIALYHFTLSGTLALEATYGALYAHLIVAGAFTAAALITLGVLAATRAKALSRPAQGALSDQRSMQIAMLVEAVMHGYALARRPRD